MSEGDVFLHRTINDLILLLRTPGTSSRPVENAEKTVRSFCTKELRGVPGGIGDVEEYVANATLDLVIMSVWALAASQVDLERLPVSLSCNPALQSFEPIKGSRLIPQSHTFARDTRTWVMFKEAMEENESKLRKVTGRVRAMMSLILNKGGNTLKSVRGRLRDVAEVLDGQS